MSETLRFDEILGCLERCMAAEPVDGACYALSRDASLLAEIIGEMNWRRLDSIPWRVLVGEHRDVVLRWMDNKKES